MENKNTAEVLEALNEFARRLDVLTVENDVNGLYNLMEEYDNFIKVNCLGQLSSAVYKLPNGDNIIFDSHKNVWKKQSPA